MDKLRLYAGIHDEWVHCKKCPLGERACTHVVGELVGVASSEYVGGPMHVMFIGEGPGRGEDATGRPFIGPAGRLLRETVRQAGLGAYNLCYTNLLACRPSDTRSGPNRPPQVIEVEACKPRLIQLIKDLQPSVIMPIGNVPMHYVQEVIMNTNAVKHECYYHEAQHPAALLRQGGLNAPHYQEYVDKFIAVRLRLGELNVR